MVREDYERKGKRRERPRERESEGGGRYVGLHLEGDW